MAFGSVDQHLQKLLNSPSSDSSQEMKLLILRIGSFNHWPSFSKANPLSLAQAGFYYTNVADTVQCFSCKVSIKDWNDRGDPMLEHRKLSPNCPFLADSNTSIPLTDPREELSLTAAFNRLVQAGSQPGSGQSSTTSSPQHAARPRRPVENPPHRLPSPREQPPGRPNTPPEPPITNIPYIISSVPPSGKITRANADPNSTDPRKVKSLDFMDKMRSEKERKATYYDFPPGAQLSSGVLAKAGFFYTGEYDRTQCCYCRGALRNWECNDDPLQVHMQYFPECPFVSGRDVGNVPIVSPGEESGSSESSGLEDEPGNDPHLFPATHHHLLRGEVPGTMPKNPAYANEGFRLLSFEGWPSTLAQQPSALAEAGFYYMGHGDHVKCFHCDGGLRNWEPTDDPWEEHAHWFPRCKYVLHWKGERFVESTLTRPGQPPANPNIPPSVPVSGPTHTPHQGFNQSLLRAFMDSEMVLMAADMGFSLDVIRTLAENRISSTGSCYETIQSLMEALLNPNNASAVQQQQQPVQQQQQQQPVQQQQQQQPQLVQQQQSQEPQEQQPPEPTEEEIEMKKKLKALKKKLKRQRKAQERQQAQAAKQAATTPPAEAPSSKEPNEQPQGATGGPVEASQLQSLQEENEQLKEQRLCSVCMDREKNVVFLPCAHLCTCCTCAPQLRKCPICRKPIKGSVRVFTP